MKYAQTFSGQKSIKEYYDHLQDSKNEAIKERTSVILSPGIVEGLTIIPSSFSGSIDILSGTAYDKDGERIEITVDDNIPWEIANVTKTTPDGTGTDILTPRSTGCKHIELPTDEIYYIWIKYLLTTDISEYSFHKLNSSKKLYYKRTDGYDIRITTSNSHPTFNKANGYIFLGVVDHTAGGNIASSNINMSGRDILKINPDILYATEPLLTDILKYSFSDGIVSESGSACEHRLNNNTLTSGGTTYDGRVEIKFLNSVYREGIVIDGKLLKEYVHTFAETNITTRNDWFISGEGAKLTDGYVGFKNSDAVGNYIIYAKIYDGGNTVYYADLMKRQESAPVFKDDTGNKLVPICSVYWDGNTIYDKKIGGISYDNSPCTDIRYVSIVGDRNIRKFEGSLESDDDRRGVGKEHIKTKSIDVARIDDDLKTGENGVGYGLILTGTVVSWAGDYENIPLGWLLCDGREVSQTYYASLYAVVGTRFNIGGETSGKFRLPNLCNKFIVGSNSNTGSTIDGAAKRTGGNANVTLTTNELPSHTHGVGTFAIGYSGRNHFHGVSGETSPEAGHVHSYTAAHDLTLRIGEFTQAPGGAPLWVTESSADTGPGSAHIHNVTFNSSIADSNHTHGLIGDSGSTGDGEAFSIVNPFVAIPYIIKC